MTRSLNRSIAEFVKRETDRRGTPYRKLIRQLLDVYMEQQGRRR